MKVAGSLVLGTRGSEMALVQSNQVAAGLVEKCPELKVKLKIITTKGDINQAPIPLDTIGKAWFTKEIEEALLNGQIDFAVHSLKDVLPELPSSLEVRPVLIRDDPRDALIGKKKLRLSEMPKHAVIGTDSLRRKALILHLRPDLTVQSIRGNANTRLEKLDAGGYDALIMAAAGLDRIHKAERITEYLPAETFIPAIGQGMLAVEAKKDRHDVWKRITALRDERTMAAASAEKLFALAVGSGCKLPIGCYVKLTDTTVHIYAMVGSLDAKKCVIKTATGPSDDAGKLVWQLATAMAAEPFVAEYARAFK